MAYTQHAQRLTPGSVHSSVLLAHSPAWKRVVGRVLKRGLAWRRRGFRPGVEPTRWVRVGGVRLLVLKGVFNPAIHFTSAFLARYLTQPGVVPQGGTVLDLGTGSGLLAIAAARAWAGRVVATDVNPAAVRCAEHNVARCGLAAQVNIRQGNMFVPVAGERFDLIACNPPYFRGNPSNLAEQAYFGGPNYEWLDRFATEAHAHLSPAGRMLLVLGDAADIPAILSHLQARGWQIRMAARRNIWLEMLYVYELRLVTKDRRPTTEVVGSRSSVVGRRSSTNNHA